MPRPIGAQSILYGDKVINIVNQKRRGVWPALDGDAYIANGDLGMVVGQYKGQKSKLKGLPSKLEVEFAGQLGHKFGFWKGEFGITFLVLPNRCRLLSRELLYTALTRRRERLPVDACRHTPTSTSSNLLLPIDTSSMRRMLFMSRWAGRDDRTRGRTEPEDDCLG